MSPSLKKYAPLIGGAIILAVLFGLMIAGVIQP